MKTHLRLKNKLFPDQTTAFNDLAYPIKNLIKYINALLYKMLRTKLVEIILKGGKMRLQALPGESSLVDAAIPISLLVNLFIIGWLNVTVLAETIVFTNVCFYSFRQTKCYYLITSHLTSCSKKIFLTKIN